MAYSSTHSRIFEGYRALGLCSNEVPLSLHYIKKKNDVHIVTCVGYAFHVYSLSKLALISVGDAHPGEISCLACDAYLVFTGCKNVVRSFSGGKLFRIYKEHTQDVRLLVPFGNHLLTVDEESTVIVWDIYSTEKYIALPFDKKLFEILAAVHPGTYINKILFGSKQGPLELWNLKSGKLVHHFDGWKCGVTVLKQAPAVDVIAVGLIDGRVFLHNFKFDETLMCFYQDWGKVTNICFRFDNQPYMMVASEKGHIGIWDLEERRLLTQIRDAHRCSISGMESIPSQPLMVTSASDNSVKVWIFDLSDGGARILHERSGHFLPPTCIRFHGMEGHTILSSGGDTVLRSFSTVHESHDKCLGRSSFNKAKSKKVAMKDDSFLMPPITFFASEPSKQSDWDSVAACHFNELAVSTWDVIRSTMNQRLLKHKRFERPKFRSSFATCLSITSCGNFVLIGYSTGHLDIYNLQSGIFRGSLVHSKDRGIAHDGPLSGVVIDGVNSVTITSCSTDYRLRFWKFRVRHLLGALKLLSYPLRLLLHRQSGMLGVICASNEILIIDIDERTVARRFSLPSSDNNGATIHVTDMSFSSDGRWFIVSADDGSIRTWNLPMSKLIDCFLTPFPVTSISFSPTGEYLATSHKTQLGIYLWSNRTQYSHTTLPPLDETFVPQTIQIPVTRLASESTVDEDKMHSEQEEESNSADSSIEEYVSPQQISEELISLSKLPTSRWLNLLVLDVIKERNKPRLPPKVPKTAPFFLPITEGLHPELKISNLEEEKDTTNDSPRLTHIQHSQPLELRSEFEQQLIRFGEDKNSADSIIDYLNKLQPTKIDEHIKNLSPHNGGSIILMENFLYCVNESVRTKRNADLVNSYLALFMKTHDDILIESPNLIKILKIIKVELKKSWCDLNQLFDQSLSLVSYLKGAALS